MMLPAEFTTEQLLAMDRLEAVAILVQSGYDALAAEAVLDALAEDGPALM